LRIAVENMDETDYSLKQSMLKHNIILYITGYKISELPRESGLGGGTPTRPQRTTTR
jgi:hypothetical protein